ncbi:SRPBCC domain-containing protein [Phytoactinopolyspora endophytica]|uniref:SRPBCC domain-containing protein n=1 Tax=Phytoactinopolyspora endophytica TaxID=1642495 RepID=UPI00101C4D82|nr:SRPBCC domain-containing protein [Phytoactinopolyspora endophytica]
MTESFTTTFTVERTPEEVSAAISKPQVWWNQLIEGKAETVGDEFGFDMPGVHRTRIRVAELAPGWRVVWHVLENHFSFVNDQDEWVGTDIVYDIAGSEDGTTVTLTHVGLLPQHECYEVCSGAWAHHLNAGLRAMLTGGDPAPMTAEQAAATAREFANQ